MLRRSLMLSLLLATATSGADDVPAGAPTSAPASAPAASAVAGEAGQPARGEVTSSAAQRTTAPSAAATSAAATSEPARKNAKDEGGDKTLSGMSILGNQEAPKSLVIVPWKSSQLGDAIGLAQSLDDGRGPVDREVFMRQLDYYDIRSGSK